jgi:hypothetical protein
MLDALELIEAAGMKPKSTWQEGRSSGNVKNRNGTRNGWSKKIHPGKLARRIQMGKNWVPSRKHVKTDCGIHMPPKEAKYKHSGKQLGVATAQYWGGGSSDHPAYWWNDDDKKPERAIDVIHAHAHVQGNDTTHGPGFAQAVFEIVDAQYEGGQTKKTVNDIYADLGIIKGRGRKITAKPRSSIDDYIKAAPSAQDALRALIEGLDG